MFKFFKLLGICSLLLVAGGRAQAQAGWRQVEVEQPANYRDPILITKVTLGGKDVECHLLNAPGGTLYQPVTPFQAGDDWLENLAVQVFNRTTKTIVVLRMAVEFPEARSGPSSPMWTSELSSGIPPAGVLLANGQPLPREKGARAISLKPGAAYTLRISDRIDEVRSTVQRGMPNRTPAHIVIHKSTIYFDDSMKWYGATYPVPDTSKPGQWTLMDPLYFPGNREANWPIPGRQWGGQSEIAGAAAGTPLLKRTVLTAAVDFCERDATFTKDVNNSQPSSVYQA